MRCRIFWQSGAERGAIGFQKNANSVEQVRQANVLAALPIVRRTMNHSHEEMMAFMANDLFNKRQRLIEVNQQYLQMIDAVAAQALEAEYRIAEAEYLEAKSAFARAMKGDKRAA
ncbi:MAG: hypothetical protein ACREX0_20840 [Noviherbaspirillum sp.]